MRVQGLFYVASGLWPIVHLPSFEAVTGPKRDRWLVQTTGGLIAAVGLALLVRPTRVLGIASALALGAADLIFVARRRIPPIYLADAAVELAAAWRAVRTPEAGRRKPDALC